MMLDTIWETTYQTLINTPWWVYVLIVFLIKLGINASKTNIVSLKKLFIVPVVFTFMSIHTLLTSFQVNLLTLSTWTGSILIGIFLGWLQIYRYKLRVDKQHFLIEIPGTWSTMIIIIIIFVAKYYFGYQLAVDPHKANQTGFEFSMLAISGTCTGLFIGRFICYIYRLQTTPSINLLEKIGDKNLASSNSQK